MNNVGLKVVVGLDTSILAALAVSRPLMMNSFKAGLVFQNKQPTKEVRSLGDWPSAQFPSRMPAFPKVTVPTRSIPRGGFQKR